MDKIFLVFQENINPFIKYHFKGLTPQDINYQVSLHIISSKPANDQVILHIIKQAYKSSSEHTLKIKQYIH